ncbi:MAG: hypothetical protein V3U75_12770 [Methylococcaceae bacterium]
MKVWIARAKNGALSVFPGMKPKKFGDYWEGRKQTYNFMVVENDNDPIGEGVTFENSPQEIELTKKTVERRIIRSLKHQTITRWADKYLKDYKEGSVVIYCGENAKGYFRPKSQGYTFDLKQAGVFSFEDAWDHVKRCGPEKKMKIMIVNR